MATDTATVHLEETTAQLETTTIADAPVDDDLPVEESETKEAAVPKEDPIQIKEKRRIYIGNLPFSATETEIKEFLEPYDLEYVTVPPHRFIASRNTGYAFVDFKSSEDAAKVIEELNGKTITDRTVFIQLAKPPSERRESRRTTGRGGFRRGRGGRAGGARRRSPRSGNEVATEDQGEGEVATEEAPKETAPAAEAETAGESTEKPTVATPASNDENAPPANSAGRRPQRRRPAHKRGPPKEGVPSATTVFVANLSYSCTTEKLKEYFVDYKPEWAHVALKRTPAFVLARLAEKGVTPRPPRALGFGFVRFADEDTQKKAIAELNGKEFEGRAISVRVAIDSQIENAKKEENGEEVDDEEAADEATGTVEAASPTVQATA
ncbi:hypothetical protein V1525DRAFT_403004 [Lipomyces kononenkoae]|uniref:Uncharacterized protein n=1 Tax=Lipomyces kononenkoae TaxID=34357 RepID=A0ACC3T2J5_LIPKO